MVKQQRKKNGEVLARRKRLTAARAEKIHGGQSRCKGLNGRRRSANNGSARSRQRRPEKNQGGSGGHDTGGRLADLAIEEGWSTMKKEAVGLAVKAR